MLQLHQEKATLGGVLLGRGFQRVEDLQRGDMLGLQRLVPVATFAARPTATPAAAAPITAPVAYSPTRSEML
jgi:hypothetical protein